MSYMLLVCKLKIYLIWGQPLALYEFPKRTTEITSTKCPISAGVKEVFLYKLCPFSLASNTVRPFLPPLKK
jgi:hypothetical protein